MPPTLRSRRTNNADSTAHPRVVEIDTDEEREITRATAAHQREQESNKAEKASSSNGRKTKKVYKTDADADEDEERFISVLDVIRVLVTIVLLSVGLSYYVTAGESFVWGYEKERPWWMRYKDIKQFLVRYFPSVFLSMFIALD